MKTLKYIILGVIFLSLVISSFSFSPSNRRFIQTDKVIFCETYTRQEIISKLDTNATFSTLVHMGYADPESSRIGSCKEADLKALWNHVQGEAFQSSVPENLIIVQGVETIDQMIPLYAIRKSDSNTAFPEQQDIKEVRISKSEHEENYALYISFSESGTKKWASMTQKNKGKDIAILFNGKVIAAPRVREEIKNGKCMISGKYTESEIIKLKAALEN